jgi:hypothetical protein
MKKMETALLFRVKGRLLSLPLSLKEISILSERPCSEKKPGYLE